MTLQNDIPTWWNDPNPPIQITDHEGFLVVRDDLLSYGSKIRFVDYLIQNIPQKELVYGGSPATGFAQISLPVVASRYNKEVHLFSAQRDLSKLHPYQKEAIRLGAKYHWVPFGMLSVTTARAREYVRENPEERYLFPFGLEHPSVQQSIIKVCQTQIDFIPDHVWSVAGSGTLSRGLQLAWPTAQVHIVSVGHTLTPKESGRAIVHRSPYKFDKPVKPQDAPPYPSAATYDAKVWRPMLQWYKEHNKPSKILVWNVA